MDQIFVDANIFLEIFLKNDKVEACKAFLRKVQQEKRAIVTTDFIVYSCLLQIIRQLKNKEDLEKSILFFDNLPMLSIIHPSFDELSVVGSIMESHKLDFDDSLIIACMESYGLTELASFDKHFDKVKTIKRLAL